MGALRDIFNLFFPPLCPMCGEKMEHGSGIICARCRWEIPLTGFGSQIENPVCKMFWGHLPIVNASAFAYFIQDGRFRRLIHSFKYRDAWRLAYDMGLWYGHELREGGLYADVDIVVPVPLHLRKRLKRGYNQSEYIARAIAKALSVEVDTRSVVRRVHNKSQTQRKKSERWDNVKGIFKVGNTQSLSGKHILLVDDVLTTGATIISCGEAICRAVPDCRLSIATLAVSQSELARRGLISR